MSLNFFSLAIAAQSQSGCPYTAMAVLVFMRATAALINV